MNNEIKEKIKAYYIGDDIDKLLDYITNLQEEIERLNNNQVRAIEILEQDKASASFNTAERITINILKGE